MNPFDLPGIEGELGGLQAQMAAEDFWADVENANKISRKVKQCENKLARFAGLERQAEDAAVLIEMGCEEEDLSLHAEVQSELDDLQAKVEKLRLETLLKGAHDDCAAVLSLHAGAGGTEAQDWVEMLFRMYTRYCERQGYVIRVLDMLDADEGGIKSVTFEVTGENAYGYLKAEAGVHRLVRISPFDASGRRHTSFASLDVAPILEDDECIQINPDELRIDTYRSSGAGGQHVNKTESAIRITHLPTNIVVQCQNERSQIQNRETAMKMLKGKLAEVKERETMERMSQIKGEMKKIEWGSQIRSYVFQPYTLVKDHRTGAESGNVNAVMEGDIGMFIDAFLIQS